MAKGLGKDISITLPAAHWVLVVTAIDHLNQAAMAQLESIKKAGTDPKTLPESVVTALVGPLLARGAIIDELVKQGVMVKEAADKMGAEALVKLVQEHGNH